VELQLVGTRGIARHPSTKQEQPTPRRGRLALILVDLKTGDFLVPKSKAKRLRILFYKKYIFYSIDYILRFIKFSFYSLLYRTPE